MKSVEHLRGEIGLRRWREAMRAKGEKFGLAEVLPPLPPDKKWLAPDSVAAAASGPANQRFPWDGRDWVWPQHSPRPPV